MTVPVKILFTGTLQQAFASMPDRGRPFNLRVTRDGDMCIVWRIDEQSEEPLTFFDQVNRWNQQFGLPSRKSNIAPHFLSLSDFRYRVNFLFEELREFIDAHARRDIHDCADALGDLAWVVCGTAAYMSIPLNEVWAEITRANYGKRPWQEGDPVKPRNYVTGELVKPDGWKAPDIQGVIEQAMTQARSIL